MKQVPFYRTGSFLFRAAMLIFLVVQAISFQGPAAAQAPIEPDDGPQTVRWTGTGPYQVVSAAIGMRDIDPTVGGDITLAVPGTPVAAFLFWSAIDNAGGDTDGLILTVDADPTTTTTVTSAPADTDDIFWFGGVQAYTYAADITSLIQQGTHTYNIADFEITFNEGRFGASIVVVYNDPVAYNEITIQDGLNAFFPTEFGSGATQTQFRHSAASCVDFAGAGSDRQMEYTILSGGTSGDPTPIRTNALWSYTDSGSSAGITSIFASRTDPLNPGTLPPTFPPDPVNLPLPGAQAIGGVVAAPADPDYLIVPIIDVANPAPAPPTTSLQPPLGYSIAHVDHEYDRYTGTLNIPAGDEFACLQIQTFFDQGATTWDPRLSTATDKDGASGIFQALVTSIPVPTIPTPPPVVVEVNDPVVTKTGSPQNPVPGAIVTWTITVYNPNNQVVGGIIVQDPVDSTYFSEIVSATASRSNIPVTVSGLTVTYNVGQVFPNETVTLTLVTRSHANVPGGTTVVNTTTLERPGRPPQSYSASVTFPSRLPATGYARPIPVKNLLPIAAGIVLVLAAGLPIVRRRQR